METIKTLTINEVMLLTVKPFFKENMPILMGKFLETNGMTDETQAMLADIATKFVKSFQPEAIALLSNSENMAQVAGQFATCCYYQIGLSVEKAGGKLAKECYGNLKALVPYMQANFLVHFVSNLLAIVLAGAKIVEIEPNHAEDSGMEQIAGVVGESIAKVTVGI